MKTRMFVAVAFLLAATFTSLTAQEVFTTKDGATLPQPLQTVKAGYTAAAKDAHIEGKVMMSAVVLSDGAVGEVTVTESLDKEYGLDAQAVGALKQWRFRPGQKDGKPVAVRVDVEMTFTLK